MKKLCILFIFVLSVTGAYALEFDNQDPVKPASPVYFGIGLQVSTNIHLYHTGNTAVDTTMAGLGLIYSAEADLLIDFAVKINSTIAIGIEGMVGYQVVQAIPWSVSIFGRFDFSKMFIQPYAGVFSACPDYFGLFHSLLNWQSIISGTATVPSWYYANLGIKLGGQVGWVDLYFNFSVRFNTVAHLNLGFGATVHFLKN